MSDFEVSPTGGNSGNANLVYILYLVGLLVGITSIVGVIMAYINKGEADEVTRSHYINQIHIFWKFLLYTFVSVILSVVLIGLITLIVAIVWYIIRIIKGMNALGRGEAYPNPQSWWI